MLLSEFVTEALILHCVCSVFASSDVEILGENFQLLMMALKDYFFDSSNHFFDPMSTQCCCLLLNEN